MLWVSGYMEMFMIICISGYMGMFMIICNNIKVKRKFRVYKCYNIGFIWFWSWVFYKKGVISIGV